VLNERIAPKLRQSQNCTPNDSWSFCALFSVFILKDSLFANAEILGSTGRNHCIWAANDQKAADSLFISLLRGNFGPKRAQRYGRAWSSGVAPQILFAYN
jgi:hypothetical protein